MSKKVQIKEVKPIKEHPYRTYIDFLKNQMCEISKVPKERLNKYHIDKNKKNIWNF